MYSPSGKLLFALKSDNTWELVSNSPSDLGEIYTDGKNNIYSVSENQVSVYDISQNKWNTISVENNGYRFANSLVVDNNGKVFLSQAWKAKDSWKQGDGKIYKNAVFTLENGNWVDVTYNFDIGNMTNGINPEPVGNLSVSSDGKKIYISSEKGIWIYRGNSWEKIVSYWGNRGVFDPNDGIIAYSGSGVDKIIGSQKISVGQKSILFTNNSQNLNSFNPSDTKKDDYLAVFNAKY